MAGLWREVADGIYVRRHRWLDLNVCLVVGSDRCLLVDTGTSHRHGRELLAELRRITRAPYTVVNTHAHFDHFFGNSAFRPSQIWGHVRCAEMARDYGEVQRRLMAAHLRQSGQADADDLAAEFDQVVVDPPDRTFERSAVLDVGGRRVELHHLGRGHTDNDIVVVVPDTGVVLAGDLVEEGAPPSFDDAFPLDWPDTLGRLLSLVTGPVVPGHGEVVDRDHVQRQAEELTRVAEVAKAAHRDGRDVDSAWHEVPFPEAYARTALRRAFRQLRGEPAYDSPEEILTAAGVI